MYQYIRQRKINWQDWRYTSFVVFVRYSQNIRRHNTTCRDKLVADVIKKHWIETQNFQVDFQSVYFKIDYIDFIIK